LRNSAGSVIALGEAFERLGQDGVELLAWKPGEQRHAGRRGMERHRPAEPVGRHHVRGLHLVDIDQLQLAGHGEAHCLAGPAREPGEVTAGQAHERLVARPG
jgi:hypothetical protein